MHSKTFVPAFATAAAVTLALAVSANAEGSTPAYVGTWATDPAQCTVPQERQEAPLVLSEKGYDQHESHCKFSSVEGGAENVWTVKSNCTIEGAEEPYDFTLTVSGDTLTVGDDSGTRDLLKCK